jgi:hypothetical protein
MMQPLYVCEINALGLKQRMRKLIDTGGRESSAETPNRLLT